jgi:uncharacterized protein YqgV (UPF0045/DUF77 family)
MKATAELQVVPIGAGVSVRQDIMRVVELLQGHDFILETHASGTNIEGELDTILADVARIHKQLLASGKGRLIS